MTLDWPETWIFSLQSLQDINLTRLGVAVVAMVLSYALLSTGLRLALDRAGALAQRSRSDLDDLLVAVAAGTRRWLLAGVALLIGLNLLDLSATWQHRVDQAWFALLALQLGLWLQRAIALLQRRYLRRHAREGGATTMTASATLMGWALRSALWAVVLLAVLSNLGVNITAFVASLGVGGIAVALAVQNILADLFASLAIAVDKPFEVGDSIKVGQVSGTVEKVGLKTTRIRSVNGEQVVMSNTDLLKQTVFNFKRLEQRRVVFNFLLQHDARPEQVKQVPALLRQLVSAQPALQFLRAHFKGFEETGLSFELVYRVQEASFDVYMDAQQAINLGLLEGLHALGLGLAGADKPAQPAAVEGLAERPHISPDGGEPTTAPEAMKAAGTAKA